MCGRISSRPSPFHFQCFDQLAVARGAAAKQAAADEAKAKKAKAAEQAAAVVAAQERNGFFAAAKLSAETALAEQVAATEAAKAAEMGQIWRRDGAPSPLPAPPTARPTPPPTARRTPKPERQLGPVGGIDVRMCELLNARSRLYGRRS